MPNALVSYLKGALEELKRVAWPTKKETTQHTLIVIGLSLALAAFLGAVDYLLNLGFEQLILNR